MQKDLFYRLLATTKENKPPFSVCMYVHVLVVVYILRGAVKRLMDELQTQHN